ncbi:MAG TPA: hypothetical protein VF723_00710 [Pyrinomonadaceae bacterium]
MRRLRKAAGVLLLAGLTALGGTHVLAGPSESAGFTGPPPPAAVTTVEPVISEGTTDAGTESTDIMADIIMYFVSSFIP